MRAQEDKARENEQPQIKSHVGVKRNVGKRKEDKGGRCAALLSDLE